LGVAIAGEVEMGWKEAIVWGVALALFLAVATALGPVQGRELERLLIVLIVIGIIAWRIWKGR
jgi:hypothetical protein